MLTEVMEHFGLARDLHTAGFYETPHHKQVLKEIRAVLPNGRLIAVTGLIGSGKTVFMRRLYTDLGREGRIIVSRSLSIDKGRVSLTNLVAALFYDISPDKEPSIPTQGERRERALQALVRQGRKPVALFVDEAHDLHHRTLVGLKRLMEVITDGGGSLTIVLVGHQKLRNDLRRPTMEEVGYRTTVFGYEGVAGHQREYITWLLNACVAADMGVSEMIDDAAMELLATRLRTPLQIEQHLRAGVRGGVPGGREAGDGGGGRERAVAAHGRPGASACPARLRCPRRRRTDRRQAGRSEAAAAGPAGSEPGARDDRADDGSRPASLIRLKLYGQKQMISRPSQSGVG